MKKIIMVLSSLLLAMIIVSSGYGLWSKNLIIEGDIEVVPDPEVIAGLQSEISSKEAQISELVEQQRMLELAEQQRTEGEQKVREALLVEEQNKSGEQVQVDDNNTQDETQGTETETSVVDAEHTDHIEHIDHGGNDNDTDDNQN